MLKTKISFNPLANFLDIIISSFFFIIYLFVKTKTILIEIDSSSLIF